MCFPSPHPEVDGKTGDHEGAGSDGDGDSDSGFGAAAET